MNSRSINFAMEIFCGGFSPDRNGKPGEDFGQSLCAGLVVYSGTNDY
ncbi:MAG: hypothetical protein ABIT07_06705 [Ferruginibacter sp.]